MSASFIMDCSLTMAWAFRDEATTHTTELLQRLETEAALVPSLWHLEITNVLAVAERAGRITPQESDQFIGELSKLDIEVEKDAEQRAFEHLLPLCRTHQLSSYDATYLDLAVRRRLPLASLDAPLRKVAGKLGVQLLGK